MVSRRAPRTRADTITSSPHNQTRLLPLLLPTTLSDKAIYFRSAIYRFQGSRQGSCHTPQGSAIVITVADNAAKRLVPVQFGTSRIAQRRQRRARSSLTHRTERAVVIGQTSDLPHKTSRLVEAECLAMTTPLCWMRSNSLRGPSLADENVSRAIENPDTRPRHVAEYNLRPCTYDNRRLRNLVPRDSSCGRVPVGLRSSEVDPCATI